MFTWVAITKLADTIVMLPAAALCIGGLALRRAWRLALSWCLLLTAGLAIVAATKIAFIGWGIGIPSLDFTGFSGHAMRATAIAPVLFYLICQKAPPPARLAAVLAGIGFGLLIGVSRIMVHAHSVSEVVGGCLVGAVIGLVFISMLAGMHNPVPASPVFALGLLVLVLAPMSEPAPTERWLQHLALSLSGNERPFVRADWKTAPVNRPI
jgi:membrane-associated phospholipid phosphatase